MIKSADCVKAILSEIDNNRVKYDPMMRPIDFMGSVLGDYDCWTTVKYWSRLRKFKDKGTNLTHRIFENISASPLYIETTAETVDDGVNILSVTISQRNR